MASSTEKIQSLEKGIKERDNIIKERDNIIKERDTTIEKLNNIIKDQGSRLRYYENENSPPSADSLAWKEQKAQRKKERARSDAAAGNDVVSSATN